MKNLTLVDPDLDTDAAVSGLGLSEAIVDVGSDGLQRDSTLMILLCTCYFRTAQTAGNLSLYTSCAKSHSASDGLLESTAEGNSSFKLRSDVLSDELSVKVRLLNFNDVERNLFAAELALAELLELLYLSAALAYNHAGLCAENVDVDSLGIALDLDLGHACRSKELKEEFTQLVIFNEVSPKSLGSAYQRDSQSLITPILRPVGLIFCPIV